MPDMCSPLWATRDLIESPGLFSRSLNIDLSNWRLSRGDNFFGFPRFSFPFYIRYDALSTLKLQPFLQSVVMNTQFFFEPR